jgi:hypothetical protein
MLHGKRLVSVEDGTSDAGASSVPSYESPLSSNSPASGVFDCTQLYPQHDGHDIGAMETKESHESS